MGMMGAFSGMNLAGGFMNSIGQIITAEGQAGAAGYNAIQAARNSSLATKNSQIAAQATDAQVGIVGMQNKAAQGAIKTNLSAGNTVVNSGSNVKTLASSEQTGLLNAMTTRSEGVKKAFGFVTDAENYKAQQSLDVASAENTMAALPYEAEGTLLGSASQAGSQYMNYQLQTGLGS